MSSAPSGSSSTPSPSPSPTSPADVDPVDQVVETLTGLYQAIFSGLPRLLLAAVVVALFVVVGRVLRALLRPRLARARTESFGRIFASIAYAAVVLVGVIVALPVAFAGLDVAALLGGLSILAVAAGFAFQDILSNLMAGVLLVLRDPFRKGDQIEVNGMRGTVEAITIRETRLRSFDGHLLLIPNKDVYTSAVDIQTGDDRVRTSFVTGVSYDTDLAEARRAALAALDEVDGVLHDPPPQAYYTEHGASAVLLDLRYWTSSRQAEVREVQDRVVEAVFNAFGAARIDIPFDILTLDAADTFAAALRGRDDQDEG
ncbi:MAG TPA: mechanosensitive ion channel family protein [Nitriliruptorales bacterium]|nr:mechanosensitive ion channel family protein [Nitriliruptorales bacterium]